jgi:hypothetical protein
LITNTLPCPDSNLNHRPSALTGLQTRFQEC